MALDAGQKRLIEQHREHAQSLLRSGEASSVCEDGLDYVLWNGDLLRTYPGADRESLLSAADVVFSYDMGWEKVEIFKLKCPE
jgi:hypothetical protein